MAHASESSADRTLLLLTLPNLTSFHYLLPLVVSATKSTRERLVIILFSRLFDDDTISHTEHWDDVQRLLTYVYVQASKVAQDAGRFLLDIDVLLKGVMQKLPDSIAEDIGMVYRASGDLILAELPVPVLSLQQSYLEPGPTGSTTLNNDDQSTDPSTYPVVALGGTFDHLHSGHKILLSMGAWIAHHKIIVGVTDDPLLKNKTGKEVMESIDTRSHKVREFLQLFRPGLVYDIVPISDVYGPTGWDPDVQALVVSKETLKGANAIATHRQKQNLPPLKTFVIDVISHSDTNLDHEDEELMRSVKMSSTAIRQWILAKQREPKTPSEG